MKWHVRHLWMALIVAALLLLVATIAVGVRTGSVP
jgi:hypothetical protein